MKAIDKKDHVLIELVFGTGRQKFQIRNKVEYRDKYNTASSVLVCFLCLTS